MTDRRGIAAVEFGLIGAALLTIVFAVLGVGSYAMTQQVLVQAVQKVSRYAIVHGATSATPATADALQTMVRSNSTGLDPALVAAVVTFTPNSAPGSTVTISVTYPWTPFAAPNGSLPAMTISVEAVSTILH